MTTSEPTTGEIVRALRCSAEAIECKDCRYKYPVGNVILCDHEQMNGNAADRLESQEQMIEVLGDVIERCNEQLISQDGFYGVRIAALTARAEQAEKERDAAIEHVHDAIFGTNHSCFYCTMENCDGCTNSTVKEHFKYRGLAPQMYLFRNEGDTK